jgi:hypothetical protein
LAGDEDSAAAEEDEPEAEARADAGVTPVEAGCDALIAKASYGGLIAKDQAPRTLRIFARECAAEPVWLVRLC